MSTAHRCVHSQVRRASSLMLTDPRRRGVKDCGEEGEEEEWQEEGAGGAGAACFMAAAGGSNAVADMCGCERGGGAASEAREGARVGGWGATRGGR